MSNDTKQIIYLLLACALLWLILSEFVGDKYITTALKNLFPGFFN